jgi:hypothetical protein
MAKTFVKMLELARSTSGAIEPGSIPATRVQFNSTVDTWAAGQLIVGTTHVALPPGTVTSNGFVYLRNDTTLLLADRVIQYGLEVAATFYPLGTIRYGMGWVDLGVCPLPGSIFVKSSHASTPLSFEIHGYAA